MLYKKGQIVVDLQSHKHLNVEITENARTYIQRQIKIHALELKGVEIAATR